MKSTLGESDAIFFAPRFSIHHRVARKWRWSSESRIDYTLLFILAGDPSCKMRERINRLEPSSIILLEPASPTEISAKQIEYLSLTIAPAYILDCAARSGMIREDGYISFRETFPEDQKIVRLAKDLAEEVRNKEAGSELIVSGLVEQIVINTLRRHANVRRSDELELSRVGLVDRRIRRAIELMHARLDEDLPIDEIAAAAHLSPFHFSRLFKKVTGTTPHAYLAVLRSQRAQKLLAETDLSITQIGAQVGYSSPSHFTKAFSHLTGVTPRAFRSSLVTRQIGK